MRTLFLALATLTSVVIGTEAMGKPLKVFILSGQSNMVGMASTNTFAHIKMFPESAQTFKEMFDEDGAPVVLDDVWISSTVTAPNEEEACGKLGPEFGARGKGDKIGPEYTFGIYMHQALQEPILLIKTAWGGKSLCFDFRSPSAGEWVPPEGHPDLIEEEPPAALPLPTTIDLPVDYAPSEEIVPKYVSRVGKFMGLRPMRGVAIGDVGGVYPIYLTAGPQQEFKGTPFQKGDLIVGVNGEGLRENPVAQWRDAFYGAKRSTWMINVTRWRAGQIETFDFDISHTLPGGRADIATVMAEGEQSKIANEKNRGLYYRMMMGHIKLVLGDIKRVYPDYDPQEGYEIAGFAWFQGWNDLVNGGTYPNRDKPRGYEQYSWLLSHFIRDVRRELGAPKMPFVIGVLGVGGVDDPPTGNKGHFQQGMAAPAAYPEFKGNVAAVHTGEYWDKQLEAIDNRSHQAGLHRLTLQHRDGLEGAALNQAYAAYRATLFTPEEEAILKAGKSNQGFHYLGSAKTMAGIGKGFAEAMLKMRNAD